MWTFKKSFRVLCDGCGGGGGGGGGGGRGGGGGGGVFLREG